jgi:large subunit ribosomal protein L9
MRIILQEPVEHLGNVGDLVTVARGYARNYLIPTGRAIEANEGNVRYLAHHQRLLEKKRIKLQAEGEARKAGIEALSLTFARRAGEQGKLFGSVTAKDIAEDLAARGIEVDRRKIDLPEPIKRLGDYTVVITVQPGIAAELPVRVVSDQPEEKLVEPAAVAPENLETAAPETMAEATPEMDA